MINNPVYPKEEIKTRYAKKLSYCKSYVGSFEKAILEWEFDECDVYELEDMKRGCIRRVDMV